MPETASIEWAADENLESAVQLFMRYRAFYGRHDVDPSACRAYLQARLREREAWAFVAKLSGTAVGLLLLYPAFSSLSCCRGMTLNDLYVAEERRGHGIGAQLVRFALAFARQQGATFVQLSTQLHNERAQKLYHALGFERDEEFAHYARKVEP